MQSIPASILRRFLEGEVNEVLPASPNEKMLFPDEYRCTHLSPVQKSKKGPADAPRSDRTFHQSLWGRR